jgi:hypothetical protein
MLNTLSQESQKRVNEILKKRGLVRCADPLCHAQKSASFLVLKKTRVQLESLIDNALSLMKSDETEGIFADDIVCLVNAIDILDRYVKDHPGEVEQ